MVRIINYFKRETEEGKEFFLLEIQGGVEVVKSKVSNKNYLTAKKTLISSTFDEHTCSSLIGTELPGNVEKVFCEPYEYTIKDTGEIIELDFRYEYQAEPNQNKNSEKSSTSYDDLVGNFNNQNKRPENAFI